MYRVKSIVAMSTIFFSSFLSAEVAPLEEALTLSQVLDDSGQLQTILVTNSSDDVVEAVNLSRAFDLSPADPLDFLALIGKSKIRSVVPSLDKEEYSLSDLQISPILGQNHIAAGTNYLAHQEETGVFRTGFLFPKISVASPSGSTIKYSSDHLLDYEVEICFRFQEDVDAETDFSSVVTGVFLCGDMTDRATLLRNIDTDDVASGIGFTDAKSGDQRFPVGALTVVPENLETFIDGVEIKTYVNGDLRQDSDGSKMIMKANSIVSSVLDSGDENRWVYQGVPQSLINGGTLKKGASILTGTPEGVVFNGIGTGLKIWSGVKWVASFSFLDVGPVEYTIEQKISNDLASKAYLQPGDSVVMKGSYLGAIEVNVVE